MLSMKRLVVVALSVTTIGPSPDTVKASADPVNWSARADTSSALAVREITIPAGAVLRLRLASPVSSVSSRVEDPVHATVQRAVVVNGVTVVPAGASVSGYVTEARRSGRVKGRARVGVRFTTLHVGGSNYRIRTASVTRTAPATKKTDAEKIAIGAGAGAIVGAIADGKKGAAIGSAIGGGGATGVVLATRGKEVALPRGTVVTTRLAGPVRVRLH